MTDPLPTTEISRLTTNPQQTYDLGRQLATLVCPGDWIALRGELGSGKTQCVRGIAAGLNIDPDAVSSPTFVMLQRYEPADAAGIPMIHVDAYRSDDLSDDAGIGLDDPGFDETLRVIEWADRAESILPADHLQLNFYHQGPNDRHVTLIGHGTWANRLHKLSLSESSDHPGPDDEHSQQSQCPICRTTVATHASSYPFCSSRCRYVDLEQWFDGAYSLSRDIDWEQDDLDEMSAPDQ